MNIVVAGMGPVGEACFTALDWAYGGSEKISIYKDDPYKGFELALPRDIKVDAVVVCVATPEDPDTGRCVTQNVLDVFEKYKGAKFLIKSTIDCLWLNEIADQHRAFFGSSFTMSPEFLRGTTGADPIKDFLDQEFAIYGGDDCRFWDELFKPSLEKLKEVRYITLEQATFAKYLENCFLATKVTFFNEMFNVFNSLGFEGFDQMVDAITLDKRIGKSHTQVPGPDGSFGWGGHCFPKDTSAMYTMSEGKSELLGKVIEINEKHRNNRKKCL